MHRIKGTKQVYITLISNLNTFKNSLVTERWTTINKLKMVAIKIIKKSSGSCKPFDPSDYQNVSFLNKYLNVKFISIREEKKLIKIKFSQQKCENGWLINNNKPSDWRFNSKIWVKFI